MLSVRLRIVLAIVLVLYFFELFRLLRRKKLELSYTLLWLLTGVILGVLVAFPKLLDSFCSLCGIAAPVNGLFTALIGLLFGLCLSLTAIVSKQKEIIKSLVQETALQEERLREIENREEAEKKPTEQ